MALSVICAALAFSTAESAPPLAATLVINLDADRARWERTSSQLALSAVASGAHAGVVRVPGVVAGGLNLHALVLAGNLSRAAYNDIVTQDRVIGGESLTLGALGCLESHVIIWRQIVELGQPALVLEDDVTLAAGFDEGLARALSHLPDDFGLLYLANIIGKLVEPHLLPYDVRKKRAPHPRRPCAPPTPTPAEAAQDVLWRMDGGHWGTYAYVASPRAAAALIRAVYPAYAQAGTRIWGWDEAAECV